MSAATTESHKLRTIVTVLIAFVAFTVATTSYVFSPSGNEPPGL
jgi:hypothetical protein